MQISGDSGTSLIPPSKATPATGKGQHWAIPLPSGTTTVEIIADDDLLVQWDSPISSGNEVVVQSSAVRIANSWVKTFNLPSDGLVEFVTDVDAHLLITHGNDGRTSLLGEQGNYYSKNFITPSQTGLLSVSNPNQNSATITWKGGGLSVPTNQTLEISWPLAIQNSSIIESSENVLIQWKKGNDGMTFLPVPILDK